MDKGKCACYDLCIKDNHAQLCWYIPPELRDQIIDQLHADRAALKACSLTCRAWLPRARSHIFRSVVVDPGKSGDAFKWLVHTSPTVARYISKLEILGSLVFSSNVWSSPLHNPFISWPTLNQPPRRRDESDTAETAAWLQRIFAPTTPPLVKLRSLRLTAVLISSKVTSALESHFNNIRALSLDGCKMLAFADFIALLNVFPKLETLCLLAAQWLPGTSGPAYAHRDSKLKLRRLEMSPKIDVAPLVSWMLAADVHTEMVSLSCSMSGQKSVSAIGDLLHATGPTLEHLKIGFQETRDITAILEATHFDLTELSTLRYLHIRCSAIAGALTLSSYRPSLSWIVILLSTVDAPQLREITFSIRIADLRVLNLEGLDVVLSHARFGSLKAVKFEIELQRESADDFNSECVRHRMLVTADRGLLRFSTCSLDDFITTF